MLSALASAWALSIWRTEGIEPERDDRARAWVRFWWWLMIASGVSAVLFAGFFGYRLTNGSMDFHKVWVPPDVADNPAWAGFGVFFASSFLALPFFVSRSVKRARQRQSDSSGKWQGWPLLLLIVSMVLFGIWAIFMVVGGAWEVVTLLAAVAVFQSDVSKGWGDGFDRAIDRWTLAWDTKLSWDGAQALSNPLGRGRIGEAYDLALRGMLCEPDVDFAKAGLHLGWMPGRASKKLRDIRYNGDGHLLTYGRAGSGKGTSVIIPNLAGVTGRSFVVTDPKGENARATASRRKALGDRVLFINPWKVDGLPNTRVNPMSRLVTLAQAGLLDVEPFEIAASIVPPIKGENSWVSEGAQDWLALRMKFLAHERSGECTPEALWRFVNVGDAGFKAMCNEMIASSVPGVGGRADALLSLFENNPKTFESMRDAARQGVRLYEPGSVLAYSTAATDYDFGALKRSPHTVFLIVPFDKLASTARWAGLVTNSLVETVAGATGGLRVTFILDEFANLPFMPVFPKALKLYRGLGVQLWPFVQGRHSMRENYSAEIARDFEDQAQVLQLWGIEDPELLRDISAASGVTSVQVTNSSTSTSQNAGTSSPMEGAGRFGSQQSGSSTSSSTSTSHQTRPVLQSEDVRAIGDGLSLLRIAGAPLVICGRLPWYEMSGAHEIIHDPRLPLPADKLANLQN